MAVIVGAHNMERRHRRMFALISCERHLCAPANNYKIEITVGDVEFLDMFLLVNMPPT